MLTFWIFIVFLCLLTLWALWRPLHKPSTLKMESVQQRNIAIANERGAEIDSAYENGDINTNEHQQARRDLEMALADELVTSAELSDQFRHTSSLSSVAILLMVPLLAYGIYSYTSNYQPDATLAAPFAANGEVPSLDEIIIRLENAVDADPQDQQGLFLLAQSFSRLGRYAEAAQRYGQLIEIVAPDADLLVNYADNRAMANNQIFTDEITISLNKALELNPEHISGLWLSGIAAQQLGEPESALRHWLILRPKLTGNTEATQELTILIDSVSKELGAARALEISAEFNAQPEASPAATGTAGITVKVSLSPELLSEVADSDSVFIFARAKSGPPMPLAASRQQVSALPITVKLDDSMAMLPQMKLSNFNEILVGARISKSGQAIPQAGDLESELITTVNTNSDTIELLISKRRS
jgi:cytochrome c-type biogenesis protein CcmH